MGKDSEYYKNLNSEKLSYINQLKEQLPIHTHPYLDHCILSYKAGTALGYSRDLLYFYEYLRYANPIAEKYPVKEIPHNIIENLK